MNISTTIGYLLENTKDWHLTCEVLGLNPWCIKEGLADRNTEVYLNFDQAKEIGLNITLK